MVTLTKEEIERYSRQILLRGINAQKRLKAAAAVVVGAGGLGATILPLLAASGVGKIIIYDDDKIERSNLGRQWIFREDEIGKNKVDTMAKFLRRLNPHIEIIPYEKKFTEEDAPLLEGIDILLEGSDSLKTKFLVSDLAKKYRKNALVASLGASQGHAMLVGKGACYRCVFDEIDAGELPTCASEGILSTFPAVVGSSVAHTALEHLLGEDSVSKFWVFEKNQCRQIKIQTQKGCEHHTYDT
ncbi:MAG: Sulfur carrier protein adenylyltransferase [Turneriella sp.]|nr:Sulfur carrier protein adenylyltransferase [Turneriella sp.]